MPRGFTGPEVAVLSGLPYGTLNRFAHSGTLVPSYRASEGRGMRRRYSFADAVAAAVIVALRGTAVYELELLNAIVVRVRGYDFNLPVSLDGVLVLVGASYPVLELDRGGSIGELLRTRNASIGTVVDLRAIASEVRARLAKLNENA